ncbi:AraC family transcriptional regulator [Pseudomonas aeruginosa]|uniref:Transcriptional regulator, AraC family n=1 Tax=Stutzerimonas stutzeri (strain A1501) TaxID=379731 RepID=A4VH68_STUS1|nr:MULTISPECIES: AraC family transcriptional regulator [Pseudomonadaceae]SAJ30853.1 virulence regulating protein [Enterobacter cloacae]ABP78319.1 transcriptional regulator, AraC family [Stutzerimonas stutzeri A1501]ELQ8316632.1 AraC family transcriptional regulator [Pseudomonas aeruginosa]MBG6795666.1 AraC family transcriptional regulator [Pseudomonas aeruginosa]MBG6799199.1 AraC family transcriptional regulator [Pseudomonas aeruginosa]
MSGLHTPASTADVTLSPHITTIGSYSLVVARALEVSGIDSARIFKSVGIPLDVVNDPLTRIPVAQMNALYRACVDVTNNPYFGLLVAKYIHLPHLHALGYALAASGTLLDFCRRLERYFQLVSQVAKIHLDEADGQIRLSFEYLAEPSGETEDAFVGFLVRTMRLLHKPGFNPLQVALHRPMPREGAEPYETLFRAPVSFGVPHGFLVFDKAELLQSLAGSCPELAQVSDTIVIGYLARLDKNDVITSVKQKIIEFLPDGDCTRDKVANALCMSPTTLQLKLSQRSTHFQQLLDETRKDLACSYLRQVTRPVTEITFLLGFSDTSNFTRAFKRWTGLSPTNFRQQL